MLCGQYVSLKSKELMYNEIVKIDLGELGLKRVETIADEQFLL